MCVIELVKTFQLAGNVFLLKLVPLAEPYVGTNWVDLGTEEKEVPVQQGFSLIFAVLHFTFLLQGRDEVEQGGSWEEK